MVAGDGAGERAELQAPDLSAWVAGNTGIPHVTSLVAEEPGPHAVVNALMHGNELCGAHALDTLLRAGVRPRRGRLTFAFCNMAAFGKFDPAAPALSRFVDEDMNRVWSPSLLEGARQSVELRRARELRPLFDTADLLLDLHSMQHESPPLTLCGRTARGRALARSLGEPGWVVADAGHLAGPRLIDYGRFSDPDGRATAILVECGQHWNPRSAEFALRVTARFLANTGTVAAADLAPWLPDVPATAPRVVEVTEAVTVASDRFRFTDDFRGMEIIPRAGTIIANDGDHTVRTAYDDCILIMPSKRLYRGQTAVRLGRLVG